MTFSPVIAIVGGGPRSLTVVERMLAWWTATPGLSGSRLEIVVIDEARPGSGALWPPDQNGLLITNTLAGDMSIFPGADHRPPEPVLTPRSVAEWAAALSAGRVDRQGVDAAVLEDAAGPASGLYPPRRMVGAYLDWHWRKFLASAPGGLNILHRKARVKAIDRRADGYELTLNEAGRTISLAAAAVVVATGHTRNTATPADERIAVAAAGRGLTFRSAGFIADQIDAFPAEEVVIVRGLGLHFYDILALTTEGRGGVFEEVADGRLHYRASGREPSFVATSRTGVPFLSRPFEPLTYDVAPLLARIAARCADRNDASFARDVWPLIASEVSATALPAQRPADVFRFLSTVIDPLDGVVASSPDGLRERILSRLDDNSTLPPSPGRHALLQVAAIVRTLAQPLAALRLSGAFDGAGAATDGQPGYDWYERMFLAVGAGPPASRIRELAALVRAGIIVFAGRDATVVVEGDHFAVSSETLPETVFRARHFVETRAPLRRTVHSAEPLLRDLLARGLARLFVDGAGRHTGALDFDRDSGRLRNARGDAEPGLFAIGLPILGADVSTAMEIVPGSVAGHGQAAAIIARELAVLFSRRRGEAAPRAFFP